MHPTDRTISVMRAGEAATAGDTDDAIAILEHVVESSPWPDDIDRDRLRIARDTGVPE